MESYCQEQPEDFKMLKDLKKHMIQEIKTTIYPNISVLHRAAIFLLPPTNQLLTFTEAEKQQTFEYVRNQMEKYNDADVVDSKAEPCTYLSNTSSTLPSSSSSIFRNFVLPKNERGPNAVQKEFEKYKNEFYKSKLDDFDVLEFWDSRKAEFPLLYKLSTKIFAIPASSADSKRIFSRGRHLISDYRSNPSTENVNNMLVLSSNSKNVPWGTYSDSNFVEDDAEVDAAEVDAAEADD
jgi:hypothetical protein